VILLLGVLYHLENLPACMRRLRSLLVEGGVVYVETQMSQIDSPLPILEYASDIYPTSRSRTRRTSRSWASATSSSPTSPPVMNLAHSYDFECASLSGAHNAYTRENPFRRFFKLTKLG
jgi:hypothetical protein